MYYGHMNFRKNIIKTLVALGIVFTFALILNAREDTIVLNTQEKQDISVFKKSKDSVVFISIHQQVRDYWRKSTFDIPKGSGSGFIWNKDGYIVTNYHVIMNASKATVTLNNGEKYKAKLVGAAADYDIAVLKIQNTKKRLSPIDLGSSSNLQVGQTVYAIGNPFGLDWTMTKGIISALERSMDVSNGVAIKHMIQTDASINPGNSGGPLLDSKGKVIGVNNMILSPSGASAGIGFSIPINTVKRVVNSIIKTGEYVRPSIGISVDGRIDALYAQTYTKSGVVIVDVIKNTPASRAKLRAIKIDHLGNIIFGDIIVGLNKKKIHNLEDLFAALDNYNKGDTVTLVILRNNKKKQISITLK